MTRSRDLATTIAGNIFNHIEQERTLVRHNIEEVIHDGLLLGAAKEGLTPPQTGGAASRELLDAAIGLVRALLNDTTLVVATPNLVLRHIDDVRQALLNKGWRP